MKKNRKDNLVYIDDILLAIKKISKFCKGIEKNDFLKNDLLMDAVVRNLEIIGEAATKLTTSFRGRYADPLGFTLCALWLIAFFWFISPFQEALPHVSGRFLLRCR